MKDMVWCCNPFLSDDASTPFFGLGDTEEDRKFRVQSSGKNRFGIAMSGEDFPKVFYTDRAAPPTLKAFAVFSGRFPVVSHDVARRLTEFDLGEGGFHPVRLLASDQQTALVHDALIWNFGNRKDTLRPEDSTNLKPVDMGPGRVSYSPDRSLKDDQVAVRRAALEGPNIWVEQRMYDHVFVSDRMHRVAVALGISELMGLKRVRVVGE